MTDLTAIAQQLAALTETLATLSGDQTPTPNPTPSTPPAHWQAIKTKAEPVSEHLYQAFALTCDPLSMKYTASSIARNAQWSFFRTRRALEKVEYVISDQTLKGTTVRSPDECTSPDEYRRDPYETQARLLEACENAQILAMAAALVVDASEKDFRALPHQEQMQLGESFINAKCVRSEDIPTLLGEKAYSNWCSEQDVKLRNRTTTKQQTVKQTTASLVYGAHVA